MPNGSEEPPQPEPEDVQLSEHEVIRRLRESTTVRAQIRDLQKLADEGDEAAAEMLKHMYAVTLGDVEPMEPYESPPPHPPPAPEPVGPAEARAVNDGFFSSLGMRVFVAALVGVLLLVGLWWGFPRDPSSETALAATTTGSTQALIVNQPTAEPGGQPTLEELRASVPFGSISWSAEKVVDLELPPDPIQPTPIGHVFTGTLVVEEVCDDEGCIQSSRMDLGTAIPVGDIPAEPWVFDAQRWHLDSTAHYLSASYGDLQCVYLRRHTWELEVTDADWDGNAGWQPSCLETCSSTLPSMRLCQTQQLTPGIAPRTTRPISGLSMGS